MAIDPGTTLILITCLICTIVLAFAGKETGDKTDTRHERQGVVGERKGRIDVRLHEMGRSMGRV